MKKSAEIILAGVIGLAFVAACLWVFLSRGRSRKAINLKLKTGAAILALSSFAVQSCVTVTCYDVAPTNYVFPTDSLASNNHIYVNMATDSTIDFRILSPESNSLWYRLSDTLKNEIVFGTVIIDQTNYNFAVPVPPATPAGTYFVRLYQTDPTTIENPDDNYFYGNYVDLVN